MCSEHLMPRIDIAAAFMADCSLETRYAGKPANVAFPYSSLVSMEGMIDVWYTDGGMDC